MYLLFKQHLSANHAICSARKDANSYVIFSSYNNMPTTAATNE